MKVNSEEHAYSGKLNQDRWRKDKIIQYNLMEYYVKLKI